MPGLITFLRNITRKKSIHLRHLFQIGILMEERGRDFYIKFADKVVKPEVKKLCNKLAEDEIRHKQLIEEALSHWLSFPIYPETLASLEDDLRKRGIFLTPPPPDSSEEEMAKFAIEQEKGTVNFYLSFEKSFPEAWKRMHIQKMVMEEQSHANDLIAAYPQFKDIVV